MRIAASLVPMRIAASLVPMRIAIVGGGIAGLYYALRLVETKRARAGQIHIFESESKCGGRVRQIRYGNSRDGVWVAGGAGIGRKKKDRRLLALIKGLHGKRPIPITLFKHKVLYGQRIGRGKQIIDRGVRRLRRFRGDVGVVTYRQHLERVLGGRAAARRFVEALGFADDLKADAKYTLQTYGIDDNYNLGVGIRIPWNLLVDRLVTSLRAKGCHIHTSTPISKITPTASGAWRLHGTGRTRPFSKVVLALPISATRALIRNVAPRSARMSRRIQPQSFMLIYARRRRRKEAAAAAKAAAAAAAKLTPQPPLGYTVVGGVLQKMIPMGKDVVMIGYADNANADRLRRYTTARILKEAGRRLGGGTSRFEHVVKHYIAEGTHYYKPARVSVLEFRRRFRESLPEGIRVVGEAVSLDQGWVEGALQSVDEDLEHLTPP
jgi:2-polyprenyl-6-methoxyphenol hydroxylase-like FAD-dependent oxidoreductase